MTDINDDIEYREHFDIMTLPSSMPELVNKHHETMYSIQNLRNTYLLSALHDPGNSLSVHGIDISSVPLFIYKIPIKCVDILICSNIIYSIQYIDEESNTPPISTTSSSSSCNNIKEKEQKESENINKILVDGGQKKKDNCCKDSIPSTLNDCCCPERKRKKCFNAVGVISSAMASLRQDDNNLV